MRAWLIEYAVTALLFGVLDLGWIWLVAADLYRVELAGSVAERPDMIAAVVFYLLFVAGLVGFVVHPSLAKRPAAVASRLGAFFGLICYGTWALTGLAVLEDFSLTVALADMAWGALASAVTCAAAHCLLTSRR